MVHAAERRRVEALFAGVTRAENQARLLRRFEADNERLRDMMAGKGPLALVASELEAINREYMAYLNGNFNDPISQFVQLTQRDNGNLPFLRGLYQGVCDPRPCVWEFTGFSVQRPSDSDAAEEAAMAAREVAPFRIESPLFRGKPD